MKTARLAVALLLLATVIGPLTARAADSDERSFDANGVSIRYLIRGAGEPVVLVHGFSASAETNWILPGVVDALDDEFQVIVLDNRGHGKSGKPHTVEAYGLEMVHDVVRLLDHLGIERAHVVGYSMGGFITLKLLSQAPERLLSAVIGGAGWLRADDGGGEMRRRLAESLEQGKGARPLIEALTPVGRPPWSEEQIAAFDQMVLATNDPLALAAVIRGMDALEVDAEALRKNAVPALAIVGELDPLKAGVDALAGVMTNLEVEIIAGGDHISVVTSAALRDGIRAFFIKLCNCA